MILNADQGEGGSGAPAYCAHNGCHHLREPGGELCRDHATRPRCVVPGCRNLQRVPRRLGLCQTHYQRRDVRARYQPADPPDGPSLAPKATAGLRPKSEDALEEMARRARLRQALFSDADREIGGPCADAHTLPISRKIVRLRQRKRWSRQELAARAGLKRWAVWAIETGRRRPLADTVKKLAVALGEPVAALLA